MFGRFSYVDDPQYIPGIFGGVADGGGFQQGIQTAHSNQSVAGYTHVFTPQTVNVLHVGFNHLHTTRFGPVGNQTGIPEQYGIQGIPQFPENGGLPSIAIGGLSTLGSNAFLPSDEISQTLQVTDDFTKVWRSHSFKAGVESQHVKFSTLQPAYSRGNFDYNGTYTDIPQLNNGGTGRAQFLLTPEAATVANGVDYSGEFRLHQRLERQQDVRCPSVSVLLLPGRLEGQFQVDAQPGTALGLLQPDQRDQWWPGELRPKRAA